MEGPARARVEVDIYELQKDSQYDTTDTSECCRDRKHLTTPEPGSPSPRLGDRAAAAAAGVKKRASLAFSKKPFDDLNSKNTSASLQLGSSKVFF